MGEGAIIRIVLVDDEELVREGLAMLLDGEPDIEVVGQAGSGALAMAVVARTEPDVVVMDIRMPGVDGVEVTAALLHRADATRPGNPLRVLVLSSFHDDDAVRGALRSGASGFLLKSAAATDAASAIRATAAGDAWLDPVVARELVREFAARPDARLPNREAFAALTPAERDVLVLLAHGLGTHAVAQHLVVQETTVKTHIGRILLKLGVRDRMQAVAAAYQRGLVLPGEAPPPPRGRAG